MSTLKPFLRLALLSAIILLNSCVKDIDLDQVDEVVIPPEAAVGLVYFTLNSEDFTLAYPNVAIDTVRLEFLDDEYIRDGLMEAEFEFQYANSFPYPVTSTVTFLSKSNKQQYQFSFPIAAGTTADNYIEVIETENIEAIRKSIKMKIKLEMRPGLDAFPGELQLKSKAFFTFEF